MILNGINFIDYTYIFPIIYIYRFISNMIRRLRSKFSNIPKLNALESII